MSSAPQPTPFAHLRTHSHYSLLSAPARVAQLVKAAAEDGQEALALTDNGNLFGAIEFYKACTRAKIKPILGMITYVAGRSRKEPTAADNPLQQLNLLAYDSEGFHNLKQLSTLGYTEGFYYRPRIDRELLETYSGGLIALSGDLSGEIGRLLQANDTATACSVAQSYRELFGPENFYLELMDTGLDAQKRVNPQLLEMHERLGIPVVATADVHYIEPEDWVAQDIMTCIRGGKAVNDPNRFRMPSRELYFKSRAQMAELFADSPQALLATTEIAERCNIEIDFKTYHLPVFDTGSDESPDDLFVRRCREGAIERYGAIDEVIQKRLDYEISVIRDLGFCSYFLITADFIEYARSIGIPVGPGRGSAAGSIVAYALQITNLDPLRYNLIFERFLNAARVSMPDIDIDFCGNRRDEVIDYVRKKYGEDCVSQIITFGTMASRGVLRDVGRVLEVPLGDVDAIAKKVPQGPGASLKTALEEDEELKELRKASPDNRRLFDLGVKLEGAVRHSSIHAAGVVVADRSLRDYVPLCKSGEDVVTQWQMTELEEVGLLKVDFLGLKTLTILTEATRLIREVHGVDIDLDALPLDDKPTYDLVTSGDTLGVFQLESTGMRELLGRLKPDQFEDLIAVLALYRPGPLGSGMVDMFVRRKHGEEPIEFPHETLSEILAETYGVIVYQEQVMRIANVLAQFSMNEADTLRKAMGKKKPEVMAEFKEKFVEGAGSAGHDRGKAKEIFELIEYFAGYGFNKSHSAAYALITYQTAWIKAHYPLEFMAANMTVESGTTDKLKEFVDELRKKDQQILPPDINRSRTYFNVEDGALRYGLGAIKGVGLRLCDSIFEQVEANGPARTLEELCTRLDQTLINRAALEALVKAGALDELEPCRKAAFEGIEPALRASARVRDDRRKGQGQLFGFAEPPPPPPSQGTGKTTNGRARSGWSGLETLSYEKEALGFYLSGHPFEKRGRFLARIAGNSSKQVGSLEHGTEVRIAGMVSSVRIMTVRNGRNAGSKMARFLLEDLDGSLPVTVFARAYQKLKDQIEEDQIVFARGRVDRSNDECGLLLDEIDPEQSVVHREVDALVVRIGDGLDENTIEQIAEIADGSSGQQRLLFEIEEGERTYRVRADRRFSLRIDDDTLDQLAAVLGPESLSFTRR